ncbi:Vacuolar membrane protein [Seiridium cupressi]
MGRHSPSLKRYMLLSALALFASSAIAQTTTAAATGDDATTTAAATTTAQTTAATTAATTATTATDDDTTTDDSGTTVPALSDTTTTAAGTTAATTGTDPTDLPTLSSTGSVTGYPSPSVPPTSNAPYMQTSNLPEGTVFIAVGAILGAFGAAILIWRAVVACLLHRSVKRAALAQHMANDKMVVPGAPPAPFYKYTDHESQGSLGAATAAAGRGVRRTTRGPVPSATPSQTNLFFSPTAGATGSAGNRSSTFLPSGFYAAGQGAPPSGHGHAISMTDLRPDSRESPGVTPRNDPIRRHPQMSTSTLNLNQAATGRAPSMYLDDLLDDNPQQFPPPGGNHGWGQSRDRL